MVIASGLSSTLGSVAGLIGEELPGAGAAAEAGAGAAPAGEVAAG